MNVYKSKNKVVRKISKWKKKTRNRLFICYFLSSFLLFCLLFLSVFGDLLERFLMSHWGRVGVGGCKVATYID